MTTVLRVYTGDTKKFRATITGYDGTTLSNADGNVTFKVYDAQSNIVIHTGISTNVSTGIYEYEYTFPGNQDSYYVEFSGQFGGYTHLARQKVRARTRV